MVHHMHNVLEKETTLLKMNLKYFSNSKEKNAIHMVIFHFFHFHFLFHFLLVYQLFQYLGTFFEKFIISLLKNYLNN